MLCFITANTTYNSRIMITFWPLVDTHCCWDQNVQDIRVPHMVTQNSIDKYIKLDTNSPNNNTNTTLHNGITW
jgi:hypothetical protein